MSKNDELIERLRRFNAWRRGADFEQPEPAEISQDIDATIELIEKHDQLYAAIAEMVNERQPLGIYRPVYQRALVLVNT